MRRPAYLSPTQIGMYYKDPDEYYQIYLSDNKKKRFPQTQPMSIGSSFDAYVKNFLHEKLFGKGHDPKFDLVALFETQVESHNRTWAWENGKYVFEQYRESGCLFDLLHELSDAVNTPRFEADVLGVVSGYREGITDSINNIPFNGKPDCYFINKEGAHIIHDWKVNGYCSKADPKKGYVRLREIGEQHRQHKGSQFMRDKGVLINISDSMENIERDWARQLSIYSWLCGESIGDPFIASVDQIVCDGKVSPVRLRFAEHRCKVSVEAQWNFFSEAAKLWHAIETGHIFQDLSREDSDNRCRRLDQGFGSFEVTDDQDAFLNQMLADERIR